MRVLHAMNLPLFCLLGLSACAQLSFDEKMQSLYQNTVPLIHENELISIQSEVYLLDVRSPEEYFISHLKGARLINFSTFEENIVADIPKEARVVVYCSVGYRSERIGKALLDMGYTNVQNLYGGIFDWKNKGNSVINTHQLPTDSVHTYNKSWSKWLYNGIKVYD